MTDQRKTTTHTGSFGDSHPPASGGAPSASTWGTAPEGGSWGPSAPAQTFTWGAAQRGPATTFTFGSGSASPSPFSGSAGGQQQQQNKREKKHRRAAPKSGRQVHGGDFTRTASSSTPAAEPLPSTLFGAPASGDAEDFFADLTLNTGAAPEFVEPPVRTDGDKATADSAHPHPPPAAAMTCGNCDRKDKEIEDAVAEAKRAKDDEIHRLKVGFMEYFKAEQKKVYDASEAARKELEDAHRENAALKQQNIRLVDVITQQDQRLKAVGVSAAQPKSSGSAWNVATHAVGAVGGFFFGGDSDDEEVPAPVPATLTTTNAAPKHSAAPKHGAFPKHDTAPKRGAFPKSSGGGSAKPKAVSFASRKRSATASVADNEMYELESDFSTAYSTRGDERPQHDWNDSESESEDEVPQRRSKGKGASSRRFQYSGAGRPSTSLLVSTDGWEIDEHDEQLDEAMARSLREEEEHRRAQMQHDEKMARRLYQQQHKRSGYRSELSLPVSSSLRHVSSSSKPARKELTPDELRAYMASGISTTEKHE
jgi:hypothetical protein